MDRLILHTNGAFKYEEFVGFSFGERGELFVCTKDNPPQRITPYDEETLRQSIRDSKFNFSEFCGFCGFASSDTDSHIIKQDANFPTLLILVRDSEGNVKLCDTKRFVVSAISTVARGTNNVPCCSCNDTGIYNTAFIGNPIFCVSNTEKDVR